MQGKVKRILTVCGPGNNGGDGLVAARHLQFFGYDSAVIYPKPTQNKHYTNLMLQCQRCGVSQVESVRDCEKPDLIVDAIFGFSFKGSIREPFNSLIAELKIQQVPVVSVDIPSGWNVDTGDNQNGEGFEKPAMLVSLTAPKTFAVHFKGTHYLGGRFVP